MNNCYSTSAKVINYTNENNKEYKDKKVKGPLLYGF